MSQVPFLWRSAQWTSHFHSLAVSLCFERTNSRHVETSVVSELIYFSGSFPLQDISFPRAKYGKYEIFRDISPSCAMRSTVLILWRRVRLFDENFLQVEYVVSFHGYHIYRRPVFLCRRRSFISRNLYVSCRDVLVSSINLIKLMSVELDV